MKDSLSYLFAAYTVVWLAVFAYAFSLGSRQKDLRRDLEVLRAAIEEARNSSKRPEAVGDQILG